MPYKKRVVWVEKIKKLAPNDGSIVYSLVKIARVLGFFTLIKIDEIWCSIVHLDDRPDLKS